MNHRVSLACFVLFVINSVIASYIDNEEEWQLWKKRYNKVYKSQKEEELRRHAWERSLSYVRRHGNRPNDLTFDVELNARADALPSDAGILMKSTLQYDISNQIYGSPLEQNNLPASFDWREKGVISPVENQGQMGNTVDVVATECVESSLAIETGKLVRLSVQEMYDCCNTRLLSGDIFNCVRDIGGLCSESSYPPRTQPGKCMNNSCTPIVQVTGGASLPTGREDQLASALLKQPIMAIIDASHPSFQLYKAGVYNEPNCSSKKLDHVIQIVGYGTQEGHQFWIVKNSWGVNWGMNGYILMSRNRNNQCGIASSAFYPEIKPIHNN